MVNLYRSNITHSQSWSAAEVPTQNFILGFSSNVPQTRRLPEMQGFETGMTLKLTFYVTQG